MTIYSASCPACGYEHDFTTKREMEQAWRSWMRVARAIALSAKPDAPPLSKDKPLWKLMP